MNDIERELWLESDGQKGVREVVRRLPDEQVSLEWRSKLNERLIQSSRPRRSRLWLWPVAAGACATALVMAFLGGMEPQPRTSPAMLAESRLISAHETTSMMLEVAGPGLSDVEAEHPTARTTSEDAWAPSDIDAL